MKIQELMTIAVQFQVILVIMITLNNQVNFV